MQMASVIPLCSEGKPLGTLLLMLFTTLICATDLGLFSLNFLEGREQGFFII